MRKEEEQFLSMDTAVSEMCEANLAAFGAVPAFTTTRDKIKMKRAEVDAYAIIQTTDIKGWAEKKALDKEKMVKSAMHLVGGLSAYALSKENNVLFNEVNYSYSGLMAMRDEEVPNACTLIHTKANEHAAELVEYNVTAVNISDLMADIGTYNAVRQMPSSKEDVRQAATAGISNGISDMRKLYEILDRVAKTFELTDPAFYEKYFLAREIYNIGVRHNKPEE